MNLLEARASKSCYVHAVGYCALSLITCFVFATETLLGRVANLPDELNTNKLGYFRIGFLSGECASCEAPDCISQMSWHIRALPLELPQRPQIHNIINAQRLLFNGFRCGTADDAQWKEADSTLFLCNSPRHRVRPPSQAASAATQLA